ncbi:MAG: hypothetical protein AB7K24_08630, partial [Gemmataceae bacterium]
MLPEEAGRRELPEADMVKPWWEDSAFGLCCKLTNAGHGLLALAGTYLFAVVQLGVFERDWVGWLGHKAIFLILLAG